MPQVRNIGNSSQIAPSGGARGMPISEIDLTKRYASVRIVKPEEGRMSYIVKLSSSVAPGEIDAHINRIQELCARYTGKTPTDTNFVGIDARLNHTVLAYVGVFNDVIKNEIELDKVKSIAFSAFLFLFLFLFLFFFSM
jgi:hypothetical protein